MAIIKISEPYNRIEVNTLNCELKDIQFAINIWHWNLHGKSEDKEKCLDRIKTLEEKRSELIQKIQNLLYEKAELVNGD